MTYVEVNQALADILASKVLYKRQLNPTLPMETAIMDSFQEILVETPELASTGGKQSTPELSSLAASYMSVDLRRLARIAQESPDKLLSDIRSMAASVVSQDERKGQ